MCAWVNVRSRAKRQLKAKDNVIEAIIVCAGFSCLLLPPYRLRHVELYFGSGRKDLVVVMVGLLLETNTAYVYNS